MCIFISINCFLLTCILFHIMGMSYVLCFSALILVLGIDPDAYFLYHPVYVIPSKTLQAVLKLKKFAYTTTIELLAN